MLTTVFTSLIVIIAFGGEALFGFGGGLVAVPLLSLFLDVQEAVILVAIFQFLLGFLAVRNYRVVAWPLMPPLIIGLVFGVVIGVKVLPIVPEPLIQTLLAIYILAFIAKMRLAPGLGTTAASIRGGSIAGAVSGFFQGCLGIGGPPMVMYLKGLVPDARVFRASVIFCLSIANLMRIPLVGYEELFSERILNLALSAFPTFIIAVFLGQKYHSRVPQALYFRIVHTLLALTAFTLILKAAR